MEGQVKDRAAFEAERKTGIGSSDMTDLFNLPSVYKSIPAAAGCVRKLYYSKTTEPDFPRIDKPSMQRGTDCEEIAARKLAEREGWRLVRRKEMLRHPMLPYLIAHVDREVLGRKGYGRGCAELKTMNEYVAKKVASEGLGDGYLLQMQAIRLAGAERYQWGCFGVLDMGAWDVLPPIYVEHDYPVQAEIRKRARWLWMEHVEPRIPPPRAADDPSDARCLECQWRTKCWTEGETNGNGNR